MSIYVTIPTYVYLFTSFPQSHVTLPPQSKQQHILSFTCHIVPDQPVLQMTQLNTFLYYSDKLNKTYFHSWN